METVKLVSGYGMPVVGLGTWDLRGAACKRVVQEALALGYVHIDTAWMYENQREIGEALRDAGADRSKLFLTSKVWHTHLRYDDVLGQCDEILRDLGTEYLDLLLIHWPSKEVPLEETFRAFGRIVAEGKARSIGVSNFSVDLLERSLEISEAPVCVNQIKYHAGGGQPEVLAWCQAHDIRVTAYTPLGRRYILDQPVLQRMAGRYGKTVAQVGLRWLLQKGMVVIPKASSRDHLRENLDLFGWTLSEAEVRQVEEMGE